MKKTKRKAIASKILKIFGIASLSAVILLSGYVYYKIQSTPKIDANKLSTHSGTKIYDNKGDIIWQNSNIINYPISDDEIPELYKKSVIATEDKNFETSPGVSFKDIGVAFLGVIRSKIQPSYIPRGGSTIDQQLIKNAYYNGGRGVEISTRKIQEIFLAWQLNNHYDKKDIFSFYINKLEFSENTKGIKSAMKVFFNKNPKDFERKPEDVAQIAYLVGMPQAPTAYNPYDNYESGIARQKTILQIMLKEKLITEQEYAQAKEVDVSKTLRPRYAESTEIAKSNIRYLAYTQGVLQELKELKYNINNVSMEVKTFFDKKLYNDIEKEVLNSKYYQDDKMQLGLTMMKSDGTVLAMIGSRNGDENNRAMNRIRSSGSSMKPFTAYGPLFEYFGDKYNAASIMSTANYQYPGSNAVMYNYGRYTYGNRTLTDSLRLSLNTPVGRIDDEILGSYRMKTFLHHNSLDVKNTYSSVDGIGINISTLDAAEAYNSINNAGIYTHARFVDEIKFTDGSTKKIEKRSKRSMRESTAFVLAQMLRGVTLPEFGAKFAYLDKAGYGVKTGSVAFADGVNPPAPYGIGGSDVWLNSITNNGISLSIWMGYDTPNTSPQISDNFKGQQYLTKVLQERYGGSAPMWNRPNTVQSVGGSGVREMFRVTDAKDINVINNILSPVELPQIDKLENNEKIDKDWKDKEKNNPLYKLWNENNNILNDNVISEFNYNLLGGKRIEEE